MFGLISLHLIYLISMEHVCLFVCFRIRSPGAGIIGSQGEFQGHRKKREIAKVSVKNGHYIPPEPIFKFTDYSELKQFYYTL